MLSPAPSDAARHRVPGALARIRAAAARLDPGRASALAMAMLVAVVGAAAGLWILTGRPSSTSLPTSTATTAASGPSAAGSPSASTGAGSPAAAIVVDVSGKVRHPGLYRLAAGARVDDAVRAAGGALGGVDLGTLNLAARLVDGQQVAVGAAAAGGSAPSGLSSRSSVPAPIALNSATIEQLETLPGIGAALAQRILDWRAAHGSFTAVSQLDEVAGIGPAKFAQLRALVTL